MGLVRWKDVEMGRIWDRMVWVDLLVTNDLHMVLGDEGNRQ
jgi:hypothetical protein